MLRNYIKQNILEISINIYQYFKYKFLLLFTRQLLLIINLDLIKTVYLQAPMFRRWSHYRHQMTGFRQKYLTLMRKKIQTQRVLVMKQMRRKIMRGLGYGIVLGTIYYFGNQFYSEHHEMIQVKKQLFKNYPEKVIYIGLNQKSSDLEEIIKESHLESQDQQNNLEENQTNKLKRILFLQENNEQIKNFIDKFGNNVIIFNPTDIDQLGNVIELCHKYRHKVFPGTFDLQTFQLNKQNIIDILHKLPKPSSPNKQIYINLTTLNKISVDQINYTADIDAGLKCSDVNKRLQEMGYSPLFSKIYGKQTVYDVITQNYPLYQNKSLIKQLINLTVVSASGTKFWTSTQVPSLGQIPNLTSLFIGTGGAFGVVANARLKLSPKKDCNKQYSYKIISQDKNQTILNLRKIIRHLLKKNVDYKLRWSDSSQFIIITKDKIDIQLDLGSLEQVQQKTIQSQSGNYEAIFSINNKITESLVLKNLPFSYNIQKNILRVSTQGKQFKQNEFNNLVTNISLEGGLLIWHRSQSDKYSRQKQQQKHQYLKNRIDITEVSAELMKKIVEVREGIDRRHILDSHERYQKYYKKNLFRRMTEFFW